MTKTEQR